tara:strand:+ start:1089 stop:1325 length:237 start_codon:yes stop_codon:yes gene_type:complete
MNRVYQIQNPDGQTFGLFNTQWRAQNRIDDLNHGRVEHLMLEAHRLTGIKRGKNVEKWNDLVKQIAEPFYTVKELLVQ